MKKLTALLTFLSLSLPPLFAQSPDANKELPWYERTYRWAQTNFTEDDPVKADIDFWRSHWKQARIQGVIINAGGIIAYYPSEFTGQHPATHLGGRDFFGRVNDAAREDGLEVIARMDINMYARIPSGRPLTRMESRLWLRA